jgi:hypothetical protein
MAGDGCGELVEGGFRLAVSRKIRGSESNDVFTDCQPQYPDLQGDFNIDFTGVQTLFDTTLQLRT